MKQYSTYRGATSRMFAITMLICLVTALLGCGESGEEKTASQNGVKEFTDAVREGRTDDAAASLKKINAAGQKDLKPEQLANTERLRDFLPQRVASMSRGMTSASPYNKRSPIMSTSADAMYYEQGSTTPGGKHLSLGITDAGSMSSMTRMFERDIDHTADGRHTQSITLAGFRAIQETNDEEGTVEIQLFVPPRLVINASGKAIPLETVKEAITAIDLKTLAKQAESGELAKPTPEQGVALVEVQPLTDALPQSLPGGYAHAGGGGFQLKDADYPHTQVRATYRSGQHTLVVILQAYKSERHARQASPQTAKELIRTTLPGQASSEDVSTETWAGHKVLVLYIDQYRMAVAQASLGPLIIRIQGQKIDELQPAFESLDLQKIQAAATPTKL